MNKKKKKVGLILASITGAGTLIYGFFRKLKKLREKRRIQLLQGRDPNG